MHIINTGPAKIKIWPNSILNICQSELKALSKISAGRKRNKSKCAEILLYSLMASPSLPIPYSSVRIPNSKPITVINEVYGIPVKSDIYFIIYPRNI